MRGISSKVLNNGGIVGRGVLFPKSMSCNGVLRWFKFRIWIVALPLDSRVNLHKLCTAYLIGLNERMCVKHLV